MNENHIISKYLVSLPYQVFALEKLSKFSKTKGKRFNRRISNWSYSQLEVLLAYKAEAIGKKVVFVDARYTSQRCNLCGYIDKANRRLDSFRCKKCGHEDHADYNASLNIRDLYLSGERSYSDKEISIPNGQAVVNQPNANHRTDDSQSKSS